MTPACTDLANLFVGTNTSAGWVEHINVYDIYRRCWGNPFNLTNEKLYATAEVNGELKTYKRFTSTKDRTPWLFDDRSVNPILE